jgi:hypothetical protein
MVNSAIAALDEPLTSLPPDCFALQVDQYVAVACLTVRFIYPSYGCHFYGSWPAAMRLGLAPLAL